MLAYLADLFSKVNELNLSLQGANTTIFNLLDKVLSFKRKLQFWIELIEASRFESFENLSDLLESKDSGTKNKVANIIVPHLRAIVTSFESYFSNVEDGNDWINNPFLDNPATQRLTSKLQEQLIDLSSDSTLKTKHQTLTLPQFWSSLLVEYPELACKALNSLMPFPSTYLCEKGFSHMVIIKNKYR